MNNTKEIIKIYSGIVIGNITYGLGYAGYSVAICTISWVREYPASLIVTAFVLILVLRHLFTINKIILLANDSMVLCNLLSCVEVPIKNMVSLEITLSYLWVLRYTGGWRLIRHGEVSWLDSVSELGEVVDIIKSKNAAFVVEDF